MRPLYSAWSWLFCVSDPNDPKLRGWLHPALALGFNLGLSFVLASAAFLAAPTQFHEEWLQHQSPQFLSFIHGLASVASFVGLQPALLLPWARSTLGRVLLPEELLLDKKQAFSLYSWEKGTLQPQAYALFLLLYAVLMVTCRLYEKGPMMLYDAAWACNTSMIVTAAAIWLNIPFLVSACSCWVAIDQLLWYVDMLYLLIRGRFLIGVAKYLTNRDTPWMKKLFSTHHLWFILFTTYINLRRGPSHTVSWHMRQQTMVPVSPLESANLGHGKLLFVRGLPYRLQSFKERAFVTVTSGGGLTNVAPARTGK
ncbi:hypothetical protein cyc_00141 [Cyclospora cayetanensis]|uniref:Uncharacterized protein n=1 Tax=Cyclospora cayetanensis TaxID=88456 RepID=A0A1D3D550_9EIME|nr:hypothetical protein cyc_00141 [Cyclospora cayetanensis]